jgi:hypothetical protein
VKSTVHDVKGRGTVVIRKAQSRGLPKPNDVISLFDSLTVIGQFSLSANAC